MSEYRFKEPPGDSKETDPAPREITRRGFLIGAGAIVAALAGVPAIEKAGDWNKKHETDKFHKDIAAEKILARKDIEQGLAEERRFHDLIERHNGLAEQSRSLNKDSPEYKKIIQEVRDIRIGMDQFYTKRGSQSYGLLSEASAHAEVLAADEAALTNLATMRAVYKEQTGTALAYWHNLALAYLELGDKSQEHIKNTLEKFFKYIKESGLRVLEIPPEQILYCLIDDDFNFSLKPAVVETLLNERFPEWKKYPPTHADKDSYAHYNDLSVLNIFELNRLRAVLTQLNDRTFVADVFRARDEDLKDGYTEFGGVIPRVAKSNRLGVIPSRRSYYDGAYIVPNEAVVESFNSAAGFHFHATQTKESPDVQGPSGGDQDFFGPGVVFSSVDNRTLLAHFYTSRAKRDANFKLHTTNEVVCLGAIHRK